MGHLYDQFRGVMQVNAFSSAVMFYRKLLMRITVEKGADGGKSFAHYVNHLAGEGYVPPGGREWVDHIWTNGNEANHKIKHMARKDAGSLITFVEYLLRFAYELPATVIRRTTPARGGDGAGH